MPEIFLPLSSAAALTRDGDGLDSVHEYIIIRLQDQMGIIDLQFCGRKFLLHKFDLCVIIPEH